jgi:DNA-binding SARP family transcriptional activator
LTTVHERTPDRPRFRVLGPFQVTDSHGSPVEVAGRRTRELLAVLLLSQLQVVTTDRLVDCLWGQSASAGASTTLRTYVGQARRVLAQVGTDNALVTRDGGYALIVDPSDVDAEVFERLVQRGQEALALGDAGQARTSLAAALDLWRGDVLADLGTPPYAEAFATRLQERRADAWEGLIECELALGRHGEVVGRLKTLVASDPYRERFTALLVLALYRCGRQADALAAYHETRQRLADELGLDPGPELRDLENAVLRQDPLLNAPRPSSDSTSERTGPPAPALPDAVLVALRRTPMVGRDQQLDRLLSAWLATQRGSSATALISGPAGVGKSRLVAQLAGEAADVGATVLVARCEEASVPYQPLAVALRASPDILQSLRDQPAALRGELSPLLLGEGQPAGRMDLWRSACGLLGSLAAVRPLLLVVDDADRIDEASAQLLKYVALHSPARVMLVVCYRDPPGSGHPPLAGLVGDAGVSSVADRLELPPLSEGQLHELVRQVWGAAPDATFVRRLHAHTGGNPFFAGEVVRAMPADAPAAADRWSAVPPAVRDVLRRRLDGLPDATGEALAAVAVLGMEAELVDVSRLLGISEDAAVGALEPALTAGFLVEAGQSWAGSYAFPHELMREAVYTEIPRPRRDRLHLQAAAALRSGAAVTDLDRMTAAVHLRRAGSAADPREAARASLEAAAVARRRLAWEEAVTHGEAALDLLAASASPAEQAEAQVAVAVLRMRQGTDHRRAVHLLEEALRGQVAAGDLAAAGMVHSRLGGALCLHHSVMDIPRAFEHFAAAERLLPEANQIFHMHRGRAQAAMHGLRTEVLEQASQRAEELGQSRSRPDLTIFGAWGRAWAAVNHGRIAAAFDLLEQAWQVARDLGDPFLAWGPVNAAALFATEFRLDPATGRAWCRRGLGQPRFDSFRQPHTAVVDQLGLALVAMGELAAARDLVAVLPDDALMQRMLRFRNGEWEQAAQEWAAALARDEAAGNHLDALVNGRWLAEALLALGEVEHAEEVLKRGLGIAVAGPQVPSELWIRARLARLAAGRRSADASAHLARCEEILASGEDWGGMRGQVAAARAVVHAAAGQWVRAQAGYEEASTSFATYRLPWERAATALAWAGVLAQAGHGEEAEQARAVAEGTYARLGASRWTPTQRQLNDPLSDSTPTGRT